MKKSILIVLVTFCLAAAAMASPLAIFDAEVSLDRSGQASVEKALVEGAVFCPSTGFQAEMTGIQCTIQCLAENRDCEESDLTCALLFEACVDLCENPPGFEEVF